MACDDSGEDLREQPADGSDGKAARRARRAALRQSAKRQQSLVQEWESSRYAKVLASSMRQTNVIAQKRRLGAELVSDDWLDKGDEAVLAFLSKTGDQATECLVEAHLDAAYAATKGWRGMYRTYGLEDAYRENVRRAIKASIRTFDASRGTFNAWVALNAKKPLGEWFYQWYADRTGLSTKHEAHQYHEIIQAYRSLEASLGRRRHPSEDELCALLGEKSLTKDLSRQAVRDILERGRDGRCDVVLEPSAGPEHPSFSLSADREAAAPLRAERPAPDALVFRNRLEREMTPLERAVYEARIRPLVDGGAQPATLEATACEIRESFGLSLYPDRVRRIELRLRRRFVVGGEAEVYSGSPETSTWLSSKNSSAHSDYWLCDMLALRLSEIQPRVKKRARGAKVAPSDAGCQGVSRDDCYSALLPFAVSTDDMSGNSSAGLSRPLWEISKLSRPVSSKPDSAKRAKDQGERLEAYDSYCEDPLGFVRAQPAGRVLAEEGLLWQFFFEEGMPGEVDEFCAELKEALEHDAAATGVRAHGESAARAYSVEKLLRRAALCEGDSRSCLERAMRLMLSWMFGLEAEDDEAAALARDGLSTGGGAQASQGGGSSADGSSVALAFDASLVNGGVRTYLEQGGIVRVHPWTRPLVGVGHLFEKDVRRIVGGRRADFEGREACGAINLPGQREDARCAGADSSDMRAEDPISREHALFEYSAGAGWRVFDLASSNGTLVVKPDRDGNGSDSYVIAGFGANNCVDVRETSFGRSCQTDEQAILEVAKRTGASVATKSGVSWYERGVPVRPGDVIVLGFCVIENPDGSVGLAERNGSCRIRVRDI